MSDDWLNRWNENEEQLKKETPEASRFSDFLRSHEIRKLGIICGDACLLHKTALVYGADKIELGKNVRIDAFCVLSAGGGFIKIGDYTHVSHYAMFVGAHGIFIDAFSAVGAGSKLYSVSDEFRGNGLIGPMVPDRTRSLKNGLVTLEKHTALGAQCIMMPGSTLSEGSFMVANSLLMKKSEPYSILGGSPAKVLRPRELGFRQFLKPDGSLNQ